MSVPVPLEELRHELERRSNAAYLLTVGEAAGVHCVAVVVDWDGDDLVMTAGRSSARNAGARAAVTLLAPPPPEDGAPWSAVSGYTLIVDGEASGTGAGEATLVRVRPTHAVLHRPAAAPGARLHDCVHVFDEPATDD